MTWRQRLGHWIAGTPKRAEPISFAPEIQNNWFGSGIMGSQPAHETLLAENLGVADMSTRAIANRLASLNLQVGTTKRAMKGTTEDEILDDHVLKALFDRPHANFTMQQLLRLLGQYIPTVGEAYWLKIRNGFGVPSGIQPMPPQNVEPIIRRGLIENYSVLDGKGQSHVVPGTEVIRFWWPDPETLYTAEGYLGPNGINTDAAKFAGEHLRSQYQNDATPPVVLKPLENASAPGSDLWERWQRDWTRKYHRRGGTQRGVPAMIPTGWDLIQMAISTGADITPLLEYWQSNQLMNFGVPASVLGRVISGDRSSAETNQWVFDRFTVLPIAQLIETTLTQYLAVEYDERIWVRFESFVSDDKDFVLRQEAQDLTLKVRSPQQILRDRESDPEDAWWGEVPVGTFSDQPYTGESADFSMEPDDPTALSEPDDTPPEDQPPESDSSAPRTRAASREAALDAEWRRVMERERKWRPRFERVTRAIFEAQRKDVVRRAREAEGDRARIAAGIEGLIDDELWEKLWETRLDPLRMDAYEQAAIEAMVRMGAGSDFILAEHVVANLREQGAALVKNTTETTRKRLQKALVAASEAGEGIGSIVKRINEVFAGRRRNARTIARTEVLKATQRAQVDAAQQAEAQLGLPIWLTWNDARDPAVRDSHQATLIKPVKPGDAFTLANGVQARAPGDAGTPEDSINCRCFTLETFDDPKGIEN